VTWGIFVLVGRIDGLSDERSVEQAAGPVMGDQESFDPPPQFVLIPAFAVEDGRAIGKGLLFEGRQEDGLDSVRVERHGVVLATCTTFHAPFPAVAVEKNRAHGAGSVDRAGLA
jgi:hypothetical protein